LDSVEVEISGKSTQRSRHNWPWMFGLIQKPWCRLCVVGGLGDWIVTLRTSQDKRDFFVHIGKLPDPVYPKGILASINKTDNVSMTTTLNETPRWPFEVEVQSLPMAWNSFYISLRTVKQRKWRFPSWTMSLKWLQKYYDDLAIPIEPVR
jgi:hypothetical protein